MNLVSHRHRQHDKIEDKAREPAAPKAFLYTIWTPGSGPVEADNHHNDRLSAPPTLTMSRCKIFKQLYEQDIYRANTWQILQALRVLLTETQLVDASPQLRTRGGRREELTSSSCPIRHRFQHLLRYHFHEPRSRSTRGQQLHQPGLETFRLPPLFPGLPVISTATGVLWIAPGQLHQLPGLHNEKSTT
jgi:hypothetical protein